MLRSIRFQNQYGITESIPDNPHHQTLRRIEAQQDARFKIVPMFFSGERVQPSIRLDK